MGDKKLNGLDSIEFIGKALFVSPVLVSLFRIAMSVTSPGVAMDAGAFSATSIMLAGIICILYVSWKRYNEGKNSVK